MELWFCLGQIAIWTNCQFQLGKIFSLIANFLKIGCCEVLTSHRTWYLMPCLEWSAREMEWEQGSGPKGLMSCRTRAWIPIRPDSWEGIFEALNFVVFPIFAIVSFTERLRHNLAQALGMRSSEARLYLPHATHICWIVGHAELVNQSLWSSNSVDYRLFFFTDQNAISIDWPFTAEQYGRFEGMWKRWDLI